MNNLAVKNLTLDSREVAEMLKKNHADLLKTIARNIEYLIKSKIAFNEFFQENQYKDKIGRNLRRYDITKKGCEFIAHKMTGEKGAIFTATYINKFYEMENHLKNRTLPFEETKPQITTWKGKPVIEVKQLSKITGISRFLIHSVLWDNKLTLRNKDFKHYKKENKNRDYSSSSSISVLFKEVVIMLCKKYGIYERHKEFIDNYFKEEEKLEYKPKESISSSFENLEAEANKLMQDLLKQRFEIDEKIKKLNATGLVSEMKVFRNNKGKMQIAISL